jgi:hypothetical protein
MTAMPAPRIRRATLNLLLCAILPGAMAGCSRNDRVAKANDVLRARNLELEGKVEQLTRRTTELESAVRSAAAARPELSADILECTPHVTGMGIDRLSFARDADKDGVADSLYLLVKPADGMGRFTQLVGRVHVTATIGSPGRAALVIADRDFGPREVRDAYRATITSIHYALEAPLTFPAEGAAELAESAMCTVAVAYTDGYTGLTFAATRDISLKP